jgi:polyisoprenoid-binding protein YceI
MSNQTRWSLDQAHSEISFKVRHLMISNVKGSFKTFDANVYTTDKDFKTAEVDLWIDASSITTGDEKRDEHLKGPDFLDVKNHKQITFRSSTLSDFNANGKTELWGELTIVGITKTIKLEVELGGIAIDPWGKEKVGFSVSGKINRKDWGLVWNTALEPGGLLVGDEVIISCEIEFSNSGQENLTMELEPESEEKSSK